jgi:hypothetical protein
MIYQASQLSPNGTTIDALTAQNFTAKTEGGFCDSYKLLIYNMSNTLIYDTIKIALSPYLYQDDILTHVLNPHILTNGIQYKWKIITYSGTLSATSREVSFYCYSTPVVTISVPATITEKKYTFVITCTQTEGIAIKKWKLLFTDDDGETVLETDYSYSGLLQYEYDGFANNTTISVQATVENQQNVVTLSPVYTFNVDYAPPSLTIVPTVTLLEELSAVQIDLVPPIQITGVVTGAYSYNYGTDIDLTLDVGSEATWESMDTVDEAATLDESTSYDETDDASDFLSDLLGTPESSSYVEFEVDITALFTAIYKYTPESTFNSGVLAEFLDENDVVIYQVGYDGVKFYAINNGTTVNGSVLALPSSFLIGLKGIDVVIVVNNVIYDYIHL